MLRLLGVSKTFGTGGERVHALREIDLHLKRGDFLTVIGSNGAGKSTLLNLIAGSFPPTSGRILLGDRDVTGVPAYRRARWIGRIVQDPVAGTVPSMTVAENLAIAMKRSGRRLRRAITTGRLREMRRLMERLGMGLEGRLNDPVSTLSGGERQALTVAMVTLALFFQILVSARGAAKNIDEEYITSVLAAGATRWQVYWHVVLPATFPEILTSVRVSIGLGIAFLYIAETRAALGTGLGSFINKHMLFSRDKAFAGIVAMALLGLLLYVAVDVIERVVCRWKYAKRRSL